MSYHMIKSHEKCGKIVHRLCSSCISSIQEMHKDSIEFFLLSTDKGAVGFILVQKLAILTLKIYNGIDSVRTLSKLYHVIRSGDCRIF